MNIIIYLASLVAGDDLRERGPIIRFLLVAAGITLFVFSIITIIQDK